MDFKVGGKWHYDMIGPEGERHGGVQIFEEIEFEDYFKGKDAFTDDDGNINENLPVATWKNSFIPTENGTLVITVSQYPNAEALDAVIKMGMSEGLSMAHNNLDELLEKV